MLLLLKQLVNDSRCTFAMIYDGIIFSILFKWIGILELKLIQMRHYILYKMD